jgi:hypothetical protein
MTIVTIIIETNNFALITKCKRPVNFSNFLMSSKHIREIDNIPKRIKAHIYNILSFLAIVTMAKYNT